MRNPSVLLLLAAALLVLASCENGTRFAFPSLEAALQGLPLEGDGVVTVLDQDGDGIPDAFDTDGDGTADIFLPPPRDEIPPPSSSSSSSGGVIPPSDTLRDPTNPVDGSCIVLGTVQRWDPANGDFAGRPAADNFVVLAFSKGGLTVDLQNHSVKRVVALGMSGNGNALTLRNAAMTEGFCNNKLSGQGNHIRLEASNSAPLVDLASGSGGSHKFDSLFKPAPNGLKYALSGNNHCISVPIGTVLTEALTNNNGHRILSDGSTCP